MNTFFGKKPHRKWTRRSPSGIANEMDFILTYRRYIRKNVTLVNIINVCGDQRMVIGNIRINIRMRETTRQENHLQINYLGKLLSAFKTDMEP